MHHLLYPRPKHRHNYWQPTIPDSVANNPVLKDWLTEKKSLTEKAKTHIGFVEVDLITSQWQIPDPHEAVALNIPLRRLAFIREIFICCKGTPYWYGRCVIPAPLILGKMRMIIHLGNRSLANLLFPHAPLKRSQFEFAQLNEHHFEYHKALQYASDRHAINRQPMLFARRSQFYEERHSFLLTEVFLPSLIIKLNMNKPE